MGIRAALRLDGWYNLLTGLGTIFDKLRWHTPRAVAWLDAETLESLYIGDAFARRIVEDVPKTALRQGWSVVSTGAWIETDGGFDYYEPDPEIVRREAASISAKLRQLDARGALLEAFIWGRLYGRGAVLIGADDGKAMSQPLAVEDLREIRFLEVLDRQDFFPKTYQDDPTQDGFGDPITWTVTRTSSGRSSPTEEIHASRLILTWGSTTPRRKRMENSWCDASVLQAAVDELQTFRSDRQSVSHMLADGSQAVLKMRGFGDILAGKDKDMLHARMQIIDRGRSVSRIMPIDAEDEDFSYVERTFAGVPDVLDRDQQLLAGAVSMPVSTLFGRSPAGLNATGEADIRGWYDWVQVERATTYQPAVEHLTQLVARTIGAEHPETWGITWPSLWQMSPTEQATHRKVVADTDVAYITAGVLTEDEVALARFGSGEWSDRAPTVDTEMREALRSQDLERAKKGAPEEP